MTKTKIRIMRVGRASGTKRKKVNEERIGGRGDLYRWGTYVRE